MIFETDPYCWEFEARVVSCREADGVFEIALDDTAFYPEGGGQPGDRGRLYAAGSSECSRELPADAFVTVTDTRNRGGNVVHVCDAPLPEGAAVRGVLDRDFRLANMQNHTGEHIFSGLTHAAYGYENVGFHMGDTVTIDFDGELTWDRITELEEKANRVIFADVPVEILFPSGEELPSYDFRSKKEIDGQVRLVRIDGADLCACCGTHVRRTGEIGMLKCLSAMRHRGGVRIELVCGLRAYRDYVEKAENVHRISGDLSAAPALVSAAVERVMAERDGLKLKLSEANRRYTEAKLESIPSGDGLLVFVEEGLSGDDIRRFCDRLVKEDKGSVCAVLAPDENGFQYVIGSRTTDLRAKAKELNAALNGRGGGSPQMIQGRFNASAEDIEKTLNEHLA